MTTFRQFLAEKEGDKIPSLEAADRTSIFEIIKGHCGNALAQAKAGRVLFRGIKPLQGTFFTGDGEFQRKNYERKSERIYAMLDALPSWNDAPSRVNCYICSTNRLEAESYADAFNGDIFAIFPYDDAQLGICPTADFENAFKKKLREITNYQITTTSLAYMFGTVGKAIDRTFTETKLKDIVSFLKGLTVKTLSRIVPGNKAAYSNAEAFKDIIVKYNANNLFDALNDVLAPDVNGIKFSSTSSPYPSGNHEVWVVGKCVAVKLDKALTKNPALHELWKALGIDEKIF